MIHQLVIQLVIRWNQQNDSIFISQGKEIKSFEEWIEKEKLVIIPVKGGEFSLDSRIKRIG